MATVTTQQELQDAILAADPQITVANDITLSATMSVGHALALTAGGAVLSWGGAANGTLFSVTGTGTLTIDHVVLDGLGKYATLVSIASGAAFVMNDGAVLRNVQTNSANSAVKVGTLASQGGTFQMNGGQITGVMLDAVVSSSGGALTMGGDAAITGNTAYGIAMNGGTLDMTGTAHISNNTADRPAAGILAMGNAAIRMGLSPGDAPHISGNQSTSSYCGGVYLSQGTALTMDYDAAISGNTALSLCGGVAVGGATLVVRGNAAIHGNTTQNGGGGGFFGTAAGSITIGGEASVYGNSVTADGGLGGGIYLQQAGTRLTLTGTASVHDNTAATGAGIYLATGTSLVMGVSAGDAPVVFGNDAAFNGGGLYIASGATASLGAHAMVAGSQESPEAYAQTRNTSGAAGAGVYQAGSLSLSGGVQIESLYLGSADAAPTISGALTDSAFVQLEASDYVSLTNIPITAAAKGDSYDALTDADRSVFLAPRTFPAGTPVYLNDTNDQVLIGAEMELDGAALRVHHFTSS